MADPLDDSLRNVRSLIDRHLGPAGVTTSVPESARADDLPEYSPRLIAVCTQPDGPHCHWPIDSPGEASQCIEECDCKPNVYALRMGQEADRG